MPKYQPKRPHHRHPLRRLIMIAAVIIVILGIITFFIRRDYERNLTPISDSQKITLITVNSGESSNQIAAQLQKAGLIRDTWVFDWYVHSQEVRDSLEAGTYAFTPSQDVQQIVAQLIQGKIATKLVTILPGKRLDQITQTLINAGFSPTDVSAALNSANYVGNPALVDKPAGNSLEGYLYPDSFQKTSTTSAQTIVEESLNEMSQNLTPSLRSAFAAEGLSTYQGIILASIIGQEVSDASDQAQVSQVFLSRLHAGMDLGSDVTADYGAILAGEQPNINYDSPYNTLLHPGLPPTPISNVNAQSLNAAAHPANTSWLYFVSGDDGRTYFSQTLQQQQANVAQYCQKLCSEDN